MSPAKIANCSRIQTAVTKHAELSVRVRVARGEKKKRKKEKKDEKQTNEKTTAFSHGACGQGARG